MMFTGIGFLTYANEHRLENVDVELSSTDLEPHFKFASLGLQPIRNGAAAGVGFTF